MITDTEFFSKNHWDFDDKEQMRERDYWLSLPRFRNGERPDGCQSCWQEEDAGKTSKRQNSIYKMKKSLKDWTPDSEPKLKFIDFKLGNVCNLKCRYVVRGVLVNGHRKKLITKQRKAKIILLREDS